MNDRICTIEQIKERVEPIAEKYRLKSVYIFGSYARGQATEDSDFDFMVDITDSVVRGWIIGGLYNDLCDVFGEGTDLVTTGVLSQEQTDRTAWFTKNVIRDRVLVYERK